MEFSIRTTVLSCNARDHIVHMCISAHAVLLRLFKGTDGVVHFPHSHFQSHRHYATNMFNAIPMWNGISYQQTLSGCKYFFFFKLLEFMLFFLLSNCIAVADILIRSQTPWLLSNLEARPGMCSCVCVCLMHPASHWARILASSLWWPARLWYPQMPERWICPSSPIRWL